MADIKIELFNGTRITSIPDSYDFVLGKAGVPGSYIIRKDVLFGLLGSQGPLKGTFTSANQDGNDVLTITHDRGTLDFGVWLFNQNGEPEPIAGIVKADGANSIKIYLGSPVSGTWKYIIEFF